MPKNRKGLTPPKKDYVGGTVRLATLLPPGYGSLVGYTFTNVTIDGPAMVMRQGNTPLIGCTILTPGSPGEPPTDVDIEAVLWEVNPEERPRVMGVIGLRDCTFTNCMFDSIGFVGDAVEIQKLRAHLMRTG